MPLFFEQLLRKSNFFELKANNIPDKVAETSEFH